MEGTLLDKTLQREAGLWQDTLTPVSICANREAAVLKEKPQTASKSQVTDLLHLVTQQEESVL